MQSRNYSLRLPREQVEQLLSDITCKFDDSVELDNKSFEIVDLLIVTGAPVHLVEAYADGVTWEDVAPPLFKTYRPLPDAQAFEEALRVSPGILFLGKDLSPHLCRRLLKKMIGKSL